MFLGKDLQTPTVITEATRDILQQYLAGVHYSETPT